LEEAEMKERPADWRGLFIAVVVVEEDSSL
jgi:hypothetical protein